MTTCSESSAAAGEPIAGTAVAGTWRWLAIEHRPTWRAKAVEQAELPPESRRWLDAFAGSNGARVQLIRRLEGEGPLTAFFADVRARTVRRLALDRPEDLAELDLDRLLAGDVGEPHDGPLVWVCTHGQRDVCCGRFGGRVYAALRDVLGPDAVWQTSHLGGHRFAPTLLWLPEGLCYGRLSDADVHALVDASARGEVHALDTLRGRVGWSAEAQAAESELRRRTGVRAIDAITLVSAVGPEVVLRLGAVEHRFVVERRPLPTPVISSCGKSPGPAFALTATSAR